MAARHKIKRVIGRIKKKAVESPLTLSFWTHITHNRLFKLVKFQFEDIRSHKLLQEIKQYPIPHHLAVIMDGIRRFAKEQGIDTVEGHKLGGEKLADVMEWCKEAGYERVFTISPDIGLSHAEEYVTGRVVVEPSDGPLEFRLKLHGAYQWLHMAYILRSAIKRRLRRFWKST